MIRVDDLEVLPYGTWIYAADGSPIGMITRHWQMNGNRSAREQRCLNNGKRSDRFVYRRRIVYEAAQERAKTEGVFVREIGG